MRTAVYSAIVGMVVLAGVQALAQNPFPPAPSEATALAQSQTIPTLLGSKIIGLKLVDKNGEHVGFIKDILVAGDHLQQYILAIGGSVAGLGEKDHAVEPSKISFENDVKGTLQAKTALSKDEVRQLPEYKY